MDITLNIEVLCIWYVPGICLASIIEVLGDYSSRYESGT